MKGSKETFLFYSSILILSIISFVSCSENSVTEPTVQNDDFLKKEIIGTWGVNGYRITYFTDGSFIDSSTFKNVETQLWKADEIKKGKYRIENGIIYHYDLEIVYFAENISVPIYEGYTGSEINISNNILTSTPVDILTPNEKAEDISGYWTTKKWLTTYNSETSYEGYLECTYQMDKSNSTYFHQIIFLNDSNIKTINYNDLYDYKPPYLKLVISTVPRTLTVEFKDGLMYWYNYKEKTNLYKE